jgi:hypothetical protein
MVSRPTGGASPSATSPRIPPRRRNRLPGLNGQAHVAPDTRELVRRAAEQLGARN